MTGEWLSPSVLIQGASALVMIGIGYQQLKANTKAIADETVERKSEDKEIREEVVRRDNTQWEHINDHTVKIAKIQGKLGVNGS